MELPSEGTVRPPSEIVVSPTEVEQTPYLMVQDRNALPEMVRVT